MRRVFFTRRLWRAWAGIAVAGLFALTGRWVERLRPAPLEQQAAYEVRVTNGADAGVGTLREAILAADRSTRRVRIVVETPKIAIETPLPAIVNPLGVVLDTSGAPAVIEAVAPMGPVFDVAAPDSVISRLKIGGVASEAILIRVNGVRIGHVEIERSQTGIYLSDGADDLSVSDSRFTDNLVGVHVSSAARRVNISNNSFRSHRKAAVWAVAADQAQGRREPWVEIHNNTFENDAQSIVVMNMPARVERNTVVGARDVGVLVRGVSLTVRSNRVRSGFGFAINAEAIDGGLIADNEIDHNCAGGIILRHASNSQVLSNRLYSNGYGIVMVSGDAGSPNAMADNLVFRQFVDGMYVIGASPLVRRNRVLDNRRVGLRLASLRVDGTNVVSSEPLVTGNVVSGNEHDLVWDEYQPTSLGLTSGSWPDCSWRLGNDERTASRPAVVNQ